MKKLLQRLTGKEASAEGGPGAKLPFLSDKETLILRMLVAQGEMYGLQLVESSNGELKRGTVYVTLDRMEDKGYIESRRAPTEPGDGPAKRMYRATGLGERALAAREAFAMSLAVEFGR
ncbi:helix-turn-helix transcriptional regulator [Sorangium sp. So ce448]|uniref:PadR family transcriptional regulator n=1 Tax=Sorangium sp. So ce448 TaxID=3133314 RepID=UPI003F5FCE29